MRPKDDRKKFKRPQGSEILDDYRCREFPNICTLADGRRRDFHSEAKSAFSIGRAEPTTNIRVSIIN